MKRVIVFIGIAIACAAATVAPGTNTEIAAQGGKYPYYSGWAYNKTYNYYYSHYYYGSGEKQYHRVYYYPKKYYSGYYSGRRYVYYYNWNTGKYWGRMDLENKKYQTLDDDKKKDKISDIAESDFNKPKDLKEIDIPGAETDGFKMTLPPELPKDE